MTSSSSFKSKQMQFDRNYNLRDKNIQQKTSIPTQWTSNSLSSSKTLDYKRRYDINDFKRNADQSAALGVLDFSSFRRELSSLKKDRSSARFDILSKVPNERMVGNDCRNNNTPPTTLKSEEDESSEAKLLSPNNKHLLCFSCGHSIYGPKCEAQEGIWLHNDCFQCSTCGLQLNGIASQETCFFNGKFYCGVHGEQMKRLSLLEGGGGGGTGGGKPILTGPSLPNITKPTPKVNYLSMKNRSVDDSSSTRSPFQTKQEKNSSKFFGNNAFRTSLHADSSSSSIFKASSNYFNKPSPPALGLLTKSMKKEENSLNKNEKSASNIFFNSNSGGLSKSKSLVQNNTKTEKTISSKQRQQNEIMCDIRQRKESSTSRKTVADSNDFCAFCGIKINGSMVLAKGKKWCPEHFICANSACARRLLECGFVEAEAGKNYCPKCYETLIAPSCHKCSLPLVESCLNALGKQWHIECFCCTHCRKPFDDLSFYMENGEPYCENDWNALFTTKCEACRLPIKVGQHWIEAMGSSFHNTCFNCYECNANLEGQSFFERNKKPYCRVHARNPSRG